MSQCWQEHEQWQAELIERERQWEKGWKFVPIESEPQKVDWWHVLTFVLCLVSAACVIAAIYEVWK